MCWPWIAVVMTCLLVGASVAEERAVVQVTPGAAKAFTVGVQRFLDDIEPAKGDRTLDLRLTTEEALEFGGTVVPLDRAAYLAPEETRQLTSTPRVDCIDWTQSGADGLVEGRLSSLGPQWRVDYQVWDTARCQRLKSGYAEAPPGDVKRLGKEVADQVAAAFTGTRGAANSEIAFISDRSGRRELYVMESDGSNVRAATQNRAIKSFPSWYRDGKAVVYTSHYQGQQPGLALSSRGGLKPGPFLGAILPC